MTDRHAAKIGRVTRWTGWTQWRGSLALCLALCGLELGLSSIARAATFTTFDVPGAGTGSGQGTLATSINPAGVITGYYLDASGGLSARDFSIWTAPDAALLGKMTGARVDGFVGVDLLRGLHVTLSYPTRQITFAPPAAP